jgi:hypothetical protein
MSESNPYLIAQRANEAKELLENPLLEEAFAQMEAAYLADWRSGYGSPSRSWRRSSATCGW